MRPMLLLLAMCAFVSGCARGSLGVLASRGPMPTPNLVLSHHEEGTRLAQWVGPRADWPSVTNGFRFDDQTLYATLGYYYISGYDRFGGLYQGVEIVESGVVLR